MIRKVSEIQGLTCVFPTRVGMIRVIQVKAINDESIPYASGDKSATAPAASVIDQYSLREWGLIGYQ